MLAHIVIISCITATVMHCLHKWGLIEYYQVRLAHIFKWQVCGFCLCFWISAVQVGVIALIFPTDFFYIAIPFACASLAKAIYENGKVTRR